MKNKRKKQFLKIIVTRFLRNIEVNFLIFALLFFPLLIPLIITFLVMSTISSFSFLFPPFSVEEIGEKVFLVLIIINLFAFIIGFIEEFDYLYDSYKKCEKEDECDSKDEKPEDQKLGGIMFFRVLLVIKAIIISTPLFMALFQKISIWSILKKMVSAFFLTLFF